MPRAETKRPIGVPESVYLEMEKYAREHNLFIFEVVTKAWEEFKRLPTPKQVKTRKKTSNR